MTLQEVFDQLTHGELAQLSIGGGEAGIIDKSNWFRLIPHVNLGLSALYKRFPLKEKTVTFLLETGGYTYTLKVDDLNKIERVFTADGEELALNDPSNKYTCTTPSIKVLQVHKDIVDGAIDLPEKLKTTSLDVVYRANHPELQERDADLDPDEIELELPYTHLEPLLYFIAARMHAPVGSGQFEGIISNNYTQKYETAVQQLIALNPQIELTDHNTRFSNNGWA